MPKPKRSAKTGGRKKGTPNRRSLAFSEMLEKHGVLPLECILKELESMDGPEKVRVCLDLLPYQYPKRKPIEQETLTEMLDRLSSAELESLQSEVGVRLASESASPDEETSQAELEARIHEIVNRLEQEF